MNEAFAVQVICSRDALGIPDKRLNVDGGAIVVGNSYGVSGARLTGHALLDAKRRGLRHVVVTMCIGGGMGARGVVRGGLTVARAAQGTRYRALPISNSNWPEVFMSMPAAQ